MRDRKLKIPNSIYIKYFRKKLLNFLIDQNDFHDDLKFFLEEKRFRDIDSLLRRTLPSFYCAKHSGLQSYAEYFDGRKIIDLSKEIRIAVSTKKVIPASWFRVEDSFDLIEYLKQNFGISKILDPFTGWGSRAAGAIMNGVQYYGYDMNDLLLFELNRLYQPYIDKGVISFHREDSFLKKDWNFKNDYDCVFTCPPYWKAEDYGYKVRKAKAYKQFVFELCRLVCRCFENKKCKVVMICIEDFWVSGSRYKIEDDFEFEIINLKFNISKKVFFSRIKGLEKREKNYYSFIVTR